MTPSERRVVAVVETSRGSEILGWNEIGRLTPGSYADLAILDRNPTHL